MRDKVSIGGMGDGGLGMRISQILNTDLIPSVEKKMEVIFLVL